MTLRGGNDVDAKGKKSRVLKKRSTRRIDRSVGRGRVGWREGELFRSDSDRTDWLRLLGSLKGGGKRANYFIMLLPRRKRALGKRKNWRDRRSGGRS